MKKRVWILAGTAAVLLTSTAAAAVSQVSTVEMLSTGKVDIRLEELTRESGELSSWVDGIAVMPGMEISKIPRISNEAEDCYVRALVGFSGGEESGQMLNVTDLYGISDDWVRRGDYYYYKKILRSKESTELFQGIRIPENWEQNGISDENWEVRVQVDAIQAAHIEPDFYAESPWESGGRTITVETARMEEPLWTEEDSMDVRTVLVDETAGQLLARPEDFIGDFGTFLPGDSKERKVQLENRTDAERSLYFRMEAEEEATWMAQMNLAVTVTVDGRESIRWEGNLTDSQWEEYRQICRLSPGQTGELSVALSLPEELGNEYSARKGEAVFQLCADEEMVKAVRAPKTGDVTGPVWAFMAAEATAVGFLTVGILRRFRKRKGGGHGKETD